jgi:hypothetical protein
LLLINVSFFSQQDSATKAAIEIARIFSEDMEENFQPTNIPLYDSSALILIEPSKVKEESVFADSKLQYETKGVDGKNVLLRLLEWLAELLFGNHSSESTSAMRRIIIWTIVIIASAVVIWLLSKSQLVSLVRPKSKATAFNFTDITEDLSAVNFEKKINDALLAGDYRLAVRWHYLKTLFLLDKKGLITFAPFKTNIDYYYELSKHKTKINGLKETNLNTAFIKLSRIYEYVWYGQFILKEPDYNNNAADFTNFEKQISV